MKQTTQIFLEGESPTLSVCITDVKYLLWIRRNFSFTTITIFLIGATLAGVMLIGGEQRFQGGRLLNW